MKIWKKIRTAVNYYYFVSSCFHDNPPVLDEKTFFLSTFLFLIPACEFSAVLCELLAGIAVAVHCYDLYIIFHSAIMVILVICLSMFLIDMYFKKNDRHVKIKRFYRRRHKIHWAWGVLYFYVFNIVTGAFTFLMYKLIDGEWR